MVEVTKFGVPLGGVVHGIDVRDVDSASFAELERAFAEHSVLAIPGQDLSVEDLLAFASRWGSLQLHPYNRNGEHPELIQLTNPGKAKDPNEHWHTDMSYEAVPPKITMLFALDVPEIGGDTAFANQHLAFEELSEPMRDQLRTMRAEHSAADLARLYRRDPADAPKAIHPVVRHHEVRGDEALYVCRSFTTRFEGWRRSESQGLLETLFDHSTRPDFQARHHWSVGDLVMWDNRSVLHYAVHDHGDAPRNINRVQIEGSRT